MTFYLTYRPQAISELDLVAVREELGHILTSGQFAHAYLFAGPRGTGKTSAARILAKLVNCEKNRTVIKGKTGGLGEPCNTCENCLAFASGSSLDLLEIDAASNRGIDDIRALRERIKLAPSQAAYKVYIIDEVHMLTTEAFNALLKTLEEPPSHALFILCTTEIERVPDTIVSRCTVIRFSRASNQEVVDSLAKVAKTEKLFLEDGVLAEIAKSVDGSFRDGMKILEQLSLRKAANKKTRQKLTLADVQAISGMFEKGKAMEFLVALGESDAQTAFSIIAQIHSEGLSVEQFVREVLEDLRRQLLMQVGVLDGKAMRQFDLQNIKVLIRLFSDTHRMLRNAPIAELPLELAAAEWLEHNLDRSSPRADKSNRKNGVDASTIKSTLELEKTERSKASKRVSNKPSNHDLPSGSEQTDDSQPVASSAKKGSVADVTFIDVQQRWQDILTKLRPKNHSVEALLKAARPLRLEEDRIVIEVAYQFHKEQLELPRYRAMVEEAVAHLLSDGLRLQYILGKTQARKPTTKVEHENVSGTVEDDEILKAAEEIFGSESD